MRVGGPHGRSGRVGDEKYSLPVLEIKQDGQWTYERNNERDIRENIL